MARGQGGYSRFVSFMKVALPLVALALIASVFLVSAPEDYEGTGLVFSSADLEELRAALRVKDAVFTGRSKGGDAYEFTADLIVPDGPDPTQLTASVFRGKIQYPDGAQVDLASPTAVIWLNDQIAEFSGGVVLNTSDGYTLVGESAVANFQDGSVESKQPVTATGPYGTIDAGSFSVFKQQQLSASDAKSSVIWFENKVKLVFLPTTGR